MDELQIVYGPPPPDRESLNDDEAADGEAAD